MCKAPSILFGLLLALWGPLQANGLHLKCATSAPQPVLQTSCCCDTTCHEPATPHQAPCECHQAEHPLAEPLETVSAPAPASLPIALLHPPRSLQPAPDFSRHTSPTASPDGLDGRSLLTRLQRYLI